MINFKAVGIAVALFALGFKLNNVMPTSLPFPIIALIIGLSLVFVYLSRIIIRVEKDELLISSAVVAGIIALAITYLNPAMFGITNVAKLVELPGMQGILNFLVIDVLGIPSWAVWIAFIAIIIFIIMNPLLGIGMALILLGVILFFVTPGMIFDDILSVGIGLIMAVIGITKRKGGGRGSRMLSQPIINIYDMDQPGPVVRSGSNMRIRGM